ncbi:MAG: hypothetical protein EOO90_13280 [Pedobacter sp.]|nr:MAG: hypothetical protein EOO90_13280 [Pedobacter sp.]
MKSFRTMAVILSFILFFTACTKEQVAPEKPFSITENFIAGTLTSRSGSIATSVFFIQFLEGNKALFINSSANNLVGNYTLSDTELVFEVTGGNARVAKFTLDKDKKITSAYYKALTMEYDATGELLPITETNELAGKSFKGEEFKMGQVSNRNSVIYSFSKVGTTTYGSGIDASTIDNATTTYTLIGGSGFKSVSGSTIELGFVSNRKLTIFKSSGLSYYGKYDQQ